MLRTVERINSIVQKLFGHGMVNFTGYAKKKYTRVRASAPQAKLKIWSPGFPGKLTSRAPI